MNVTSILNDIVGNERDPLVREKFGKMNFKQGTFIFTECYQQQPVLERILVRGYNAIRIWGVVDHGVLAIAFNKTDGAGISRLLMADPSSKKIEYKRQVPESFLEEGFLSFAIYPFGENKKCHAEINFELLMLNQNELSRFPRF